MTYAEKLWIKAEGETWGLTPKYKAIAMIEEAMQAQREATLERMNQYAIDTTSEPLPPEMQFIILHTEVQP